MNIYEIQPFDLTATKAAVGTTPELQSRQVPEAHVAIVTHLSFEDETSDATLVKVYKSGVGPDVLLYEELAPQADNLYWVDAHIILTEGQYIKAVWTGATASDKVNLDISGVQLGITW